MEQNKNERSHTNVGKLPFQEASLWSIPIQKLGLKIAGTPLEPILAEFEKEREKAGIRRLSPRYYLSTEWGVPAGTVAIAIPFYLAHPDLLDFHQQHGGHVEGAGRADILRYLRHEMGHVVNYAYRLYEQEEWVKIFGSITQPYLEEYRPEPFSRRYVRHLPGWYAQKHPDEDWAETFAVWMTPRSDWRTEYAGLTTALAKLQYCERMIKEVADRDPLVTNAELDEDVDEIPATLEQIYQSAADDRAEMPPGLDGALKAIFEDADLESDSSKAVLKPAGTLIREVKGRLAANVYRWTGHFPERTQALLRHLAERADQLNQVYPEDREDEVVIALTTLATSLAMNHVHRGTYLP